jgi:hypothetical protein
MNKRFDQAIVRQLEAADEIRIITSAPKTTSKHQATIWVVVVRGEPFVRSFRGAKGCWYRDIMANPLADLKVNGNTLRAKGVAVSDQGLVDEVSRAYLEKYRDSPYAKDMVRPEVLPTTLTDQLPNHSGRHPQRRG